MNITLPEGWVFITDEFLKDCYEELTTDEAIAYFDGSQPTWKESISDRVPQREIVHELQKALDDGRRAKRRQLTLLLGAGGEGKSTALRQIVGNLFKSDSYQRILWHDDPSTPLISDGSDFLQTLISSNEKWLIASDEADIISQDVFEVVRVLREKLRHNVHFLLSCRDTDWKAQNADRFEWSQYIYVHPSPPKILRGLTLEDANLIIEAWDYYGERGLGKLVGMDTLAAASRLVEQARKESQTYSADGSFLGAMLRVRIGEAIQDHVKTILNRLDARKIPNSDRSLLDAFAHIAALHAENIPLLTKSVLARSLDCPLEEVRSRIIHPLGEEAAISTYSFYVLTRHRAIAEVAKKILQDVYGKDFTEICVKLVRASREAYDNDELETDTVITHWNQLPTTFFNREDIEENRSLGIRLAQVLVEAQPKDPFPVVNLANLYRKSGQRERAVKVFREKFEKVDPDRAYYHEWGTAEGSSGNHNLAVLLSSISLADGVREKRRDPKRTMMSLSGLATSFSELFDDTNDERFVKACAATAQLGLQSNPDERATRNLERNKSKCVGKVGEFDNKEAFKLFTDGLRLACEQIRPEDYVSDKVPLVKDINFVDLEKRFNRSER